MSAYGRTPLSEENGVGLGIAYVRLETDANGIVQTANRQYWNHATKVYEPAPRDDAKHVKPCQRLADDPDFDSFVQLAAVERQAVEGFNVIIVYYTLDSSGNVTSVYRTYAHNVAVALGAVNGIPY
jgi:hypothetical protein